MALCGPRRSLTANSLALPANHQRQRILVCRRASIYFLPVLKRSLSLAEFGSGLSAGPALLVTVIRLMAGLLQTARHTNGDDRRIFAGVLSDALKENNP
jgi:hypothetical protein